MSPETNGPPRAPAAPPAPRPAPPASPPRRVALIDLVLSGALRLGTRLGAPK